MKRAIVLGATGGMGYAIAQELMTRDIETVVFARSESKLRRLYGCMDQVAIHTGDVFVPDDLSKACEKVDVIFHAIGIPYQEWADKQPLVMENVLSVAEEVGAKVAIVDNIYAYGRSNGASISEDTPKLPHTKKGKIRKQIGDRAISANKRGVPTLIAHFPDFYGPNAENTHLHYTLQAILRNKPAFFVGKQSIRREYIYTPDGAKAIVELASRENAFGQCWNIPGTGLISGEDIVSIIREYTSYQKRVGTVGRGMLRLAGIFNPLMREAIEMMYLTEEPVVLSGAKYEASIGPLPRTSYREGIRTTIEFMKQVQS